MTPTISKISDALIKPFHPPFIGLAPVVWLYFLFCYLCFPDSYVLRGSFVESDDYTYLAQTLDWLHGQGWYDNVQHRLAPPEGTFLHFTRLAELPLALFTLLFHWAQLPWMGAATLAAIVYPPLLLFGLFWAARWTAECLVPREWSRVTAYTILFSQALLFQFSLGHVGHRAPDAILVLIAVGCLFRMLREPECVRWGAWAAFVIATAMALALETLPWMLILSSCVGLWLIARGRVAARATAIYGLTLALASVFFLAIYRTPSAWLLPEIMSYSVVYVTLCVIIGVCCCVTALATFVPGRASRTIVGIVLAVGSGALFMHQFPALKAGPYGAMDPHLAKLFFTYIFEARPLGRVVPVWAALMALSASLFAVGICLYFVIQTRDPGERWIWGLSFTLLLVAIVLTFDYQSRNFRFANLFSIVPLAVFLQRGWVRIGERYHDRKRVFAEWGLLLLAGPLLTVLIPAAIDGRPFNTGVLMFPMRDVRNACDLYPVERVLSSPLYYGATPLRIMNTMSTGPELLFRTPHSVMAAPYHYNVRGNLDSLAFFSATSAEDARAIAKRDNIDLVLLCDSASDIYHTDGAEPRPPVFIDMLLAGRTPDWLKPMPLPERSGFMLFAMKPGS